MYEETKLQRSELRGIKPGTRSLMNPDPHKPDPPKKSVIKNWVPQAKRPADSKKTQEGRFRVAFKGHRRVSA
jgi:hypothetical protein